MTHEPCPCGKPLARPRPWRRALLALLLGVMALLLPRGLAEEAPAAPAADKPAPGPLCFTAVSDGATVTLQAVGKAPKVSLEISTDGKTWQEWKEPRTAKLAHQGDRLYVRAVATNPAFVSVDGPCHHFQISGKAAASGSVMSLLDRDDKLRSLKDRPRAFAQLFAGCKGLTAAPLLPATELGNSCYAGMFYDCAELTAAPELPATTLANSCYRDMFILDSGLTAAPELPATTLAEGCYSNMFVGCRLTAAPKIPANATGMKESGHETMLGGGMALLKGAKAETIAPKDLKKAKKK